MGDKSSHVSKGVNFKGQPVPQQELEESAQQELLREIKQLVQAPVTAKSEVVWDISVLIKS
jgi:hypothetical protein